MAATPPTPLEVERYIQLNALWLVVTGGIFGKAFTELLPDISFDNMDIVAELDDVAVSHEDLFQIVIPSEDEDTPRANLINARVEILVAQLLRSIDTKNVASEASRFDALASSALSRTVVA